MDRVQGFDSLSFPNSLKRYSDMTSNSEPGSRQTFRMGYASSCGLYADMAQMVAQLICNQSVVGSSPIISSSAEKGLAVGVLQTSNPETSVAMWSAASTATKTEGNTQERKALHAVRENIQDVFCKLPAS